jgi:acetoin utilization protein AcuA
MQGRPGKKRRGKKPPEGPRADAAGGDRDGGVPDKPPFFELEKMPVEAGERAREERRGAPPRKNTATLDAPGGEIRIENYCPAEKLATLVVDDGIYMFSRHNPERQKKALLNVARSDEGNVVAATLGERLVGYIGVHHPSEGERWGKAGYPWMFELGAIEVSRNFRESGMSMAMMHAAWDDPFYDDKVVLTTAFTWHWDLEATGMNKLEYRELFIELAGRFGFMEMATDEPNVTMDSANLFLVRLGRDTTFSQYQKFASLLFTNEWEAMLRGF